MSLPLSMAFLGLVFYIALAGASIAVNEIGKSSTKSTDSTNYDPLFQVSRIIIVAPTLITLLYCLERANVSGKEVIAEAANALTAESGDRDVGVVKFVMLVERKQLYLTLLGRRISFIDMVATAIVTTVPQIVAVLSKDKSE